MGLRAGSTANAGSAMSAHPIDRIEGIELAIESATENDCGFVMIGHGRFSLISYEDMDRCRKRVWKSHPGGYAQTRNGSGHVYLHRFVCDPPCGMEVDHINGDRLDNRRCNLRVCARKQNAANSSRRSHNLVSVFKGVRPNRDQTRFHARGITNKREIYLGAYDTEVEAAEAYNKWAIETFGEFAKLNQIKC